MEMESSRRPFDRSRAEPGLKKPRLIAGDAVVATLPDRSSNGPSFVQRQATSGSASRLRERDTESSDSVRGPYQQPHQELVSQYKTALAELTFNSKPIITNLTIIAGENSHAAKAIAATICLHILEVPSEQKLPSLYLLDSIVKNIGRDYIKHFAPRLPEVFCKAYRLVDPPTHHAMKHLFGTWKGVFPSQSLQIIEKELGFVTAVNGTSSGIAAARPDSQAQRTAHSIHVNPKYLEARQRLQQSTRVKGVGNISGSLSNSLEDADRPDRPASVSAGRPWADPPVKNIQRVHQEQLADPVCVKNISASYGDSLSTNFDISKRPAIGVGRANEKLEQGFGKPWYDSGSSVTGSAANQRSGFDIKHGYQSYIAHKSTNPDMLVQPKSDTINRISGALSGSWKNSEEEEYMWDDMSSKSTDYAAVNSSAKDHWMVDESERSDFEINLCKPQSGLDHSSKADSEGSAESLSTEQKGQAAFGHQKPSWSDEPHLSDGMRRAVSDKSLFGNSDGHLTSLSGLSSTSKSIGRNSFQSQIPADIKYPALAAGSVGTRKPAFGAASLSSQSPMHQRPPSQSLPTRNARQMLTKSGEKEGQAPTLRRGDPRSSHLSVQLGLRPRTQSGQDTEAPLQNSNLSNAQRLLAPNVSTSLQQRHHSFNQQQSTELKSSDQAYKPLMPQIPGFENPPTMSNSSSDQSNPPSAESPIQSSASSLLAAAVKSGILGSNLITSNLPKPGSHEAVSLRPPSPNGCPSTQNELAEPRTTAVFVPCLPPLENVPTPTTSQRKVDQPPLPLGPTPSSTESLQGTNAVSNPVSSLLSSLVSKGLIIASKTDSPPSVQPQIPTGARKPGSAAVTTSSAPNCSLPVSGATPPLGSPDVISYKLAPDVSGLLPQSIELETKSLIGCEFRPDVIRELHPEVISELHDGLPHQCSLCGLQLRLKEGLDKHLEWHSLQNSEHGDGNRPSRGWYVNSFNWIDRTASTLPCDRMIGSSEDSDKISASEEQMVRADESQCVCILCGELFEDFFSQERNEWMFKEAAYMSIPLDGMIGNTSNALSQGPIVHLTCLSETSVRDLGLAEKVKLEKDT